MPLVVVVPGTGRKSRMSMAASCSSLLHNKLLINNPSFPLPIPTHFFLSKPFKPHLLLKLSATLPLFSRHRSLAASDSFQFSQEEEEEEEDDDEELPVIETQEYEYEEEEEELRPSESNEEEEEEEEEEEGRLYVGNLPYSMTASQLEEAFQKAGRVFNVQVIYDRVTDRSRGFGFVTMGSVGEAEEAIRMFNGSQVGGRNVKVNFPEVPKGGEREVMTPRIRSTYKGFIDSPHKIYAGNLGWRLTSEGLRGAFAEQQGLLSAKVIYERDTGRSRGFGFVSFETAEDAEAALNAMNGVEVEGRPLRLNLAAERASPSTPQGNTENNVESGELLSSIGA